ncbi:hypothetical protein [Sphingomonas sp. LaA6.9]|uniref:hypothetical protein n=1 Tax=Sphingomonas sp. LaA6.9 TaxID=2919914 RepID=UPI001F4FE4A7|nr:hypothetical protein [Sphingomonas sp. LaA6.9]MCJ8159572.1 hypothetical protein [Sphingomonas sp. LaA6.9]
MRNGKDQDCNINGHPMLVVRPRRADGVGEALRTAFRDRSGQPPADMRALLDRLR